MQELVVELLGNLGRFFGRFGQIGRAVDVLDFDFQARFGRREVETQLAGPVFSRSVVPEPFA